RDGGRHALLPGASIRDRSARMAVGGGVAERFRGRLRGAGLARRSLRQPEGQRPMMLVQGYAIAVSWAISFMVLAFVVRWIFGHLNLFSLRVAWERKDAAVGHVLRGLYIALAIISLAAIQSTRSLAWALVDTVISMALVLIFFKVYDWLDPRDFSAELEADNRMLGLALEGLFIVLAAVMVGAMNFLGSGWREAPSPRHRRSPPCGRGVAASAPSSPGFARRPSPPPITIEVASRARSGAKEDTRGSSASCASCLPRPATRSGSSTCQDRSPSGSPTS